LIILGIDPGYAIVGYAVVALKKNKLMLVKCGTIETPSMLNFAARLEHIYSQIKIIFKNFEPNAVAIESLYFQKNKKTAISVAHARGVILLATQRFRTKVFEYTPLQVKSSITGFGRATKQQIISMTQRLLNLKSPAKPDDAADAIAIAICHLNVFKYIDRFIS